MTPSKLSPGGAKRVIWAVLACVIVLVFLGAVLIRAYGVDRVEDKDQIGALKDAVNVLADQLKREGVEPVVDNAGEVDPSGGIGPIGPPGRDGRDGRLGRDGLTPACLSTPTQCVGAAGATPAAGATGATGANGQDSTVPGPAGADSSVPGPAGADSAVPGPPGPECPAGYTATDVPAPLPSTGVWRVCVMNPP